MTICIVNSNELVWLVIYKDFLIRLIKTSPLLHFIVQTSYTFYIWFIERQGNKLNALFSI